ncbi:MAG: SRPBCC family protein [Deinococcales bacterium]
MPESNAHALQLTVTSETEVVMRLAHTFVYDVDGRREQSMRVSVRLDQRDDVTLLTSTTSFADRRERDAYVEGGMQRGAAEGYDRLSELLTVSLSPVADDELVLARMLDAPPDVVFAAWTEPERLDRWWGPAGSELHSQSLDLRPGGAYHYGLRTPSGDALWGTFVYREILPPERLVYVSAFADEIGTAVPNPYASTWPLEMLNTLWLADQGGRTMLVLRARPLDASAAQRTAFARAKANVSQGLATTLAQLAKHLAEG